jgi:hypothetical protein
MIEETKKSIQSILNQRISSPFYGTLIISWLLWNWKIIYLTFFISEKKISESKIDFIISNYSNVNHLVWLPLLSTAIILTVIPFITNGAYWLDLSFDRWRINKKIEIEKKQLLTIEQSISLREQILNMENRFETLLADKNSEINQLKLIISESENKTIKTNNVTNSNIENSTNDIHLLADKILNNDKLKKAHLTISYYIQGGYSRLIEAEDMNSELLSFFDSNKLIENATPGMFKWTAKGKEVNKLISEKEF